MDYRDYLKAEFRKRTSGNPLYSLRAFARDLKLAPSRVSEILAGKQGLSLKKAHEVAGLLKLDSEEAANFTDSVEALHSKIPAKAIAAAQRISMRFQQPDVVTIANDSFQTISEWHHLAILQLFELKKFRPFEDEIARLLGLDRAKIDEAVDRLIRLGMLSREKNRLKVTHHYVAVSDGRKSEAIRAFHQQILDLARRAITEQSVLERDLSAIFVPIRTADFEAVQNAIQAFRRNLAKIASAAEEKDAVYCLAIQAFKVAPCSNVI